jgi:hypothetical protein
MPCERQTAIVHHIFAYTCVAQPSTSESVKAVAVHLSRARSISNQTFCRSAEWPKCSGWEIVSRIPIACKSAAIIISAACGSLLRSLRKCKPSARRFDR